MGHNYSSERVLMNSIASISLSIGSFRPLSRMTDIAKSAHTFYTSAIPFPHLVFDEFIELALRDQVLSAFLNPGEINWRRLDNAKEIKLASDAASTFGPIIRLLLSHLNSITFVEFFSNITGIANLIPKGVPRRGFVGPSS